MDYRRKALGSMWLRACEMLNEAERLERQFFRLGRADRSPVWEPPVDIFETGRLLLVRIALPDVDMAGVRVTVDLGRLRVTARRRLPDEVRNAVIHNLELPYGRFERCISLPAGFEDMEDPTYRNGCLEVRLRRRIPGRKSHA